MSPRNEAAHTLTIRLFGPFDVRVNGEPLVPLRSRKGHWLLALLTLRRDREVERDWLAGTLWPESMESAGRANMRRTLTDLRAALGAASSRFQSPTPHSIRFDLQGADVDLAAFDHAIARGDEAALEEAVRLYRGPVLEGWQEEWVFLERSAREMAYLKSLETLAAISRTRQDLAASQDYLQRVLTVDPLREPSQRALMQSLADAGSYAAAMLVYRNFRERLHAALHAEPDPETAALYNRIRLEARTRAITDSNRTPESVPEPANGTTKAPHARLPHPLTSFISRRKEIEEISVCLETARLVTLSGSGGVGKTRLAIAAAHALAGRYPDGAWFVDLAALRDPTMLSQVVASKLGLAESSGRTRLEAIMDWIGARTLLIVLDNCEHLTEACGELAESLLVACPELRILATSRHVLGIGGETAYRVPSLSFLEPRDLPAHEKGLAAIVMDYEAARLFAERAKAVAPEFKVTDSAAGALAQICRRLDGIPLAIELAAAWVQVLSLEQIAARLDDRFGLLSKGSRSAPPRHQTLLAMMDWSYDLLGEQERLLLCRLAVFVGGWTLEAAEAVCAGGPIRKEEILDLLSGLVDKSLVIMDKHAASRIRFGMLETVREYAAQHIAREADRVTARRSHRDWFLNLAEDAFPRLTGPEQTKWLATLEAEHDNLRSALDFCRDEVSVEYALRFVGALWRFWELHGHLIEGRQWCREALSLPGSTGRTKTRAMAIYGESVLAFHQSDFAAALDLLAEGLAISRDLQDKHRVSACLNLRGLISLNQEEPGAARKHFEESLQYSRQLGDLDLIAGNLNNLGRVARAEGDFARARKFHSECLAIWRKIDQRHGIAVASGNLGNLSHLQGDYAAARACYEQALSIHREIGNRKGMAVILQNLGEIARSLGDYAAARTSYEECGRIWQDLGNRTEAASVAAGLGAAAFEAGDLATAQGLLTESLATLSECGDRRASADVLNCLGNIEQQYGNLDAARTLFEESLALNREVGDRIDIAWSQGYLGTALFQQSDPIRGGEHLAEAARTWRDIGYRPGIVWCLKTYALWSVTRSGAERACRLFAAAESLRRQTGDALTVTDRKEVSVSLDTVRSYLGEATFEEVWKQGSALSWEPALELALHEFVHPPVPDPS